MLQTSQASTLSTPLTAADDDELARAMQLSKQSYEADELLRRHIDESVAPGPDIDPSTDEDEELARALEESLRSGPAPEIEPLPLYEPIASSAPAAPSPSFLQTASSQLPEESSSWGFLTSGPSSAFVQRSTSDDTLSVSVLPPPRTSSAAATILPSSTQAVKDYASARAPGLLSASPLPSPSTTSAGQSHQDIGVPQVSSPQPAQNESWGRTATSSSQDPLPEEAPTQPFALGTDDPHSSASDGGLIWGQTTLQPPSLAPLSVQHGLPLPHHSKGAVYVIAPTYPDLLTSLFTLSDILIEGGEETRLAVQFVRMADEDGEETISILWIESGALEEDKDGGQAPPPRRTLTASSSSSATSSGCDQARRPSGHRLPPPLPETLYPPVEPSTLTYSSAHLIFQHPAFAARSFPRPRPKPQSTLVALPPSAEPLLAIGDLLAHLLSLTPYALSDALSILASSRPRCSLGPQLMWSFEDRERFLGLVKRHTPEASGVTVLNDDHESDDEGDRPSTDGRGSTLRGGKREKERSKRRWIKEHLGATATGSLSRQSHPHFVHQDHRQSTAQPIGPPKKPQVVEAAAFITPFAFPSDPPA